MGQVELRLRDEESAAGLSVNGMIFIKLFFYYHEDNRNSDSDNYHPHFNTVMSDDNIRYLLFDRH